MKGPDPFSAAFEITTMIEYDMLIMSLVIFVPAIASLVLMFVPRGMDEAMRWISLIATAITLALSLVLFVDYQRMLDSHPEEGANRPSKATSLEDRADADLARRLGLAESKAPLADDLVGRAVWIPNFNIYYFIGVDGISMPLILLTTVITFLSMIASWKIDKFVRGYCMLFLLLETGVLGTFMSLDFFLFYIFWEIMLLPMYFLIGVWGGPRREYAAIKFFLYTLLGSVFILIALLGFYFTDVRDVAPPELAKQSGVAKAVNTFDLMLLAKAGREAMKLNSDNPKMHAEAEKTLGERARQSFFDPNWQIAFFLLLFIGFAIKVPVFPFHTWLPDAHVEAPTPISMILAGILLKLGAYGILRIAYPICPFAAFTLAWYLALFGMINIVFGAFAAMAQRDFKKLVAYSSISHMGYVILGIAVWSTNTQYWAWGMNGAMYQMIAHGVSSAGMFFLVGVIYDRAHHRNLDAFRGLYEPMPLYGGMSALIFFAALGLPGLCGFVGEFMVILSTWNYEPVFAIVAALTVVITAAYILWTLQRVYMGTNPAYKDYKDMSLREVLCILPLAILAVILGVLPSTLLNWMEPHVTGLVDTIATLAK